MSSETALAISLARGPLIGTFLGLAQVHVSLLHAQPWFSQRIFWGRTLQSIRGYLHASFILLPDVLRT